MSVNNMNPGLMPMPQIAQSSTGQLFMIATHQNQLAYLFPRPYSGVPHGSQSVQGINTGLYQQPSQSYQQLHLPFPQQQHQHPNQNPNQHHQQQQQQQQRPQIQLKPSKVEQVLAQPPKPRPSQLPAKFSTNLKSSAKNENSNEESITHFIDGLMIIETFKPPVEDKPKTVKKSKTNHHQKKSEDNNINSSHNHSNNIQKHLHQQPDVVPKSHNHLQISQPPKQPDVNQVRVSPESQLLTVEKSFSNPLLPPEPKECQNKSLHQQGPPPKPINQANNCNNQPASAKELLELRAEMRDWSVSDVVRFIESHEDISQYSYKFFEDEVDGKALLLMIDRNLSFRFQILTSMFKHGPAMKIEAVLANYRINE